MHMIFAQIIPGTINNEMRLFYAYITSAFSISSGFMCNEKYMLNAVSVMQYCNAHA